MDNIKKRIKYYFPYKLFDIERRSKSQISLYRNVKMAPHTSHLNNKTKLGIYNYSKKLKSTILSSKIFSSYMENYTGQTQEYCFKSPSITFYPLKKNYHLLPLNARKNLNSSEENKTALENNTTNKVLEKPYGYKYKKTRIFINDNIRELHRSASEKLNSRIFINFSEGQHYHKILMETFGLKNIDIINSKNIIKDNFDYLQVCLKELNTIENFVGEKEFEFKIKNFGKEINYYMKIFSICLNFYEIPEKKEENNNKTHDKKKLYIPFKLLPLFYLLDYSDFKNFLSEILYFDEQSDSMNIKFSDLSQIIKKYVLYIKKIFATKNNNYINNITFYKNEFLFQSNYDWIVNDIDENDKKRIYKLKISFPKIIFEIKENKVKIINRFNKNIFLQILKKNFINWEKLILFDLFSNKKFRYIINSILIGVDKYKNCKIKIFEHSAKRESNDNNINNNNYEFFMSEIMRIKSYYFIFTPNIILLLFGTKYKFFQKIELSLQESKILYEISKYWGVINTLLKCMYKDEEKNKIYFKLNILHDFPKLALKKNKINNNSQDDILSKEQNNNIEIDKFLQYKTKSLEILIAECLLKAIQITKNEKSIFYYQMPKELYKSIISSISNQKIVSNILHNFQDITSQEKEINIINEEEKMIEKSEKTLRSSLEKYNLFKKPTFKSLKSTPLKTFNKLKTTKIATDKIVFSSDYLKSFGKKNSILKKNKFMSKDSEKKKTAKVSRFIMQKDSTKEINDNLERINYFNRDHFKSTSNINNNEDIKRDLTQINDEEKLRKFRFSKKYSIDFKKNE